MNMNFTITQMILSVLIFLVMFFGIAFLLNMLLRMSWFVAILYPLIVVFIIDEVGFFDYFTNPGSSFSALGDKFVSLHMADIVILTSGFVGAIIAGIVIKMLRKSGYQMF
ncbi:YuiB family protein [Psychrobacillus sp. FSL K6-2684]|uniref:YuiB family protein n=1 Tax=unclassified Psychrobacillus TaxID=2636677 RepID=UPI0030FCD620